MVVLVVVSDVAADYGQQMSVMSMSMVMMAACVVVAAVELQDCRTDCQTDCHPACLLPCSPCSPSTGAVAEP